MKERSNADVLTQLILEIFRLNGVLLAVGDKMAEPLGLTSARWQVLGAISMEGKKLTVSQISRRMGLTRQAVQRVVNDLEQLGYIGLTDNPNHKTAKLVGLTEKSASSLDEINRVQSNWAGSIVDGLSETSLSDVLALLEIVRARCEESKAQTDWHEEYRASSRLRRSIHGSSM